MADTSAWAAHSHPEPRRRPHRRLSLRARITLVATSVVGIALILGAFVFAALLQNALVDEVRASVERDLELVTAQLDASGPSGLNALDETDDDDRFVQVVSESGALLAASENASETVLGSAGSDDSRIIRIPNEDAEFLVISDEADVGDHEAVITTGRSLESVDDALGAVTGLLVWAVPLLVVLVALLTWLVVGRALAPVERMRREVADVTAAQLDRRVDDNGRTDEIGRLARTMNEMLDRLEKSQRTQRQFISDASHELKSPLAALRQFAEVARAHPDRLSADDLSEAVLDEGARLERLVRGMLVLARADEHTPAFTGHPVDLDDLVLAEARRLREAGARLNGEDGLTVDATLVGPARVNGDAGLLGQVVRNVTDNAQQHAVGRVALSLGSSGSLATFTVDDDGPGVPVAERERVFDRFVRLDESRARNSGGSGLGLAIVREIVHAHGGTVKVTDSALGGACFVVELPVSDESAAGPA